MAGGRQPFSVVRSWLFDLVDESGRPRFKWLAGGLVEGMTRDGPSLELIDRNGARRVRLSINRSNQPELYIDRGPGEDSEYRSILASLEADGTPYVRIYNRAREFREIRPPNGQELH